MNVVSPAQYVVAPPATATLPVQGSEKLFPVHRIYCIGRNYAAHAKIGNMNRLSEAPSGISPDWMPIWNA